MFTRTSYSLEISTVQRESLHTATSIYMCVCVCAWVCSFVALRIRAVTHIQRETPEAARHQLYYLCHAYAYCSLPLSQCVFVCICVLFCVLRAQIVLWQTVKTMEAAPGTQRANVRLHPAACCLLSAACNTTASSSFHSPWAFGHGFSQFAVGVAYVCVRVCMRLQLCVSLCSKSSLFSSYLLKPIMRSQAHLNALPPHFLCCCYCCCYCCCCCWCSALCLPMRLILLLLLVLLR